jgi:hypothetical protein
MEPLIADILPGPEMKKKKPPRGMDQSRGAAQQSRKLSPNHRETKKKGLA